MTQMTQEQMMLMAAQWAQQSGYDATKAKENAKPKNSYWSPKNGTVIFSLLPPGANGNHLSREGLWALKYFKYWVTLPSNKASATTNKDENRWTVYAGRRTYPNVFSSDPIADAMDEVVSKIPGEIMKEWRPKARCLANILIHEIYDASNNRIDADMCGRAHIADLPISFFDHLRKEAASPLGDYFNPFASVRMVLQKSGQGKNSTEYKFGTVVGAQRAPILPNAEEVVKLLTSVPDLFELGVENCKRDEDMAKEVAGKIRDWANAFAAVVGGFATGAPGMPPVAQAGGFVPGALPGALPGAPGQTWGAPQPPVTPAWPQAAQTPPTMAPQGWAPPGAGVIQQGFTAPPVQPAVSMPSFTAPPVAPQIPGGVPPWTAAPTPPVTPVAPPVQPAQIAPPQTAPAPTGPVGRPACYGTYCKLNGNSEAAQENPTNPQCGPCPFRPACVFESPRV